MDKWIGQLFKAGRERQGLWGKDLAKMVGISPAGITNIEKGVTQSPAFDTGWRLQKALQLPPEVVDTAVAGDIAQAISMLGAVAPAPSGVPVVGSLDNLPEHWTEDHVPDLSCITKVLLLPYRPGFYALSVTGDHGHHVDGDVLVFDSKTWPNPGEDVLIRTRDRHIFAQYLFQRGTTMQLKQPDGVELSLAKADCLSCHVVVASSNSSRIKDLDR